MEPRHRRQGGEGFQVRQFPAQFIDHLLDQEITEADLGQTGLGVRDGVENRRICLNRILLRGMLVQQNLHVAGHTADQGNLDKDQGFIRHAGVEKGKAPAVGIQPVFQIIPGADFVHRLVGHQFFQQHGGRIPGDPAQIQKTYIKPGRKQLAQIIAQAPQNWFVANQGQDLSPHIYQELDPLGQGVELRQ